MAPVLVRSSSWGAGSERLRSISVRAGALQRDMSSALLPSRPMIFCSPMQKLILSTIASAIALTPAVATAKPESMVSMKARWGRLNEECVGGPHQLGDAVCNARDRVQEALERRGVCWYYSDIRVTPAEYSFHPCSQPRPKGWRPNRD